MAVVYRTFWNTDFVATEDAALGFARLARIAAPRRMEPISLCFRSAFALLSLELLPDEPDQMCHEQVAT